MLLIRLLPDEKIIRKEQASHIASGGIIPIPVPNPGILYVTNKRVVFVPTQGRLYSEFECNLNELSHFSVGKLNTINLVDRDGNKYKITGMFNKSLIEGLLEAGVPLD